MHNQPFMQVSSDRRSVKVDIGRLIGSGRKAVPREYTPFLFIVVGVLWTEKGDKY